MVSPSSPSDRLITELYAMIQTGELSPGEHLEQRSIAERLSVSRTPLREALRALASDGVLAHSKNQGYAVAKLSTANLLELYSIRAFIENQLLRTVVWPNAEQLAELRRRNDDCRAAAEADDISRTLEANKAFYFEIFSWSPLTMFLKETDRLWRMCDPYRAVHVSHSDFRHQLGELHEVIIEAVVQEDHDKLVTLIEQRRRTTREALVKILGSRISKAHEALPQVALDVDRAAAQVSA